jgi:hypothetical protein
MVDKRNVKHTPHAKPPGVSKTSTAHPWQSGGERERITGKMAGGGEGKKYLLQLRLLCLQHVNASRVVHEAQVEHGRAAEVLRAARLHLRAAQGDQASLRRTHLLPSKTLRHQLSGGERFEKLSWRIF